MLLVHATRCGDCRGRSPIHLRTIARGRRTARFPPRRCYMPLGNFEKSLLRLLAANRNPESYIAGATVFLRREDSHRQSQDIDFFHDTVKGLKQAATLDATVLQSNGYTLEWVENQESLQR